MVTFKQVIRHYLFMMLEKQGITGASLYDCQSEIDDALDGLEQWIKSEIVRQIEAQ